MKVAVDKNQLSGSHVKSNYRNHKAMQDAGIELVPTPLPFGDYALITPAIEEITKRRGDKLSKIDLMLDIKVSVDRKASIDEVCGNVCSKQHERFREEAIKAQKAGAKFYVLVENEERIKDLNGILKWSNPRLHKWNKIRYMHNLGKWQSTQLPAKPPTSNITLFKAMSSMASKYGIIWVFCSPSEAAEKIVSLLSESYAGRE